MNSTSSPTPLRRSSTDKKISGVAGGLAEHLGLDPTLVRAGFAVSILFSGAGLVAYLLLLAIVPNDDDARGGLPRSRRVRHLTGGPAPRRGLRRAAQSSSCSSATTVCAPARRSCSGVTWPRATAIAR